MREPQIIFSGREAVSRVTVWEWGERWRDDISNDSWQVRTYLRWVRFVMDQILDGRPHVVINFDETSLASVRHSGVGMASGSPSRRKCLERPRERVPRHHGKVTLMSAMCDSPGLQPLLPQVVLAKYTQNAVPPRRLRDQYAQSGFPFEFWVGTSGATTPAIVRSWATRLRSVVHGYNDDAWICLVMDCSTSHLALGTIRHLRRLGILVILVPAKLTWLLQPLDVAAFGEMKKTMRTMEARHRLRTANGAVGQYEWMTLAVEAVRASVVNRCWSAEFGKLGYGFTLDVVSRTIRQYVDVEAVVPQLPSRADFADLIGRPVTTPTTNALYDSIVGGALATWRLDRDVEPARGARADLPVSRDAEFMAPGPVRSDDDFLEVLSQFAHDAQDWVEHLNDPRDAVVFFPRVA